MYIKKDRKPEKTTRYKKCKIINFRVTPAEHERITKAAKSEGLSVTKWMELLVFGEQKE